MHCVCEELRKGTTRSYHANDGTSSVNFYELYKKRKATASPILLLL